MTAQTGCTRIRRRCISTSCPKGRAGSGGGWIYGGHVIFAGPRAVVQRSRQRLHIAAINGGLPRRAAVCGPHRPCLVGSAGDGGNPRLRRCRRAAPAHDRHEGPSCTHPPYLPAASPSRRTIRRVFRSSRRPISPGVDDRHRALVVARHVVADADGDEFDRRAVLDPSMMWRRCARDNCPGSPSVDRRPARRRRSSSGCAAARAAKRGGDAPSPAPRRRCFLQQALAHHQAEILRARRHGASADL